MDTLVEILSKHWLLLTAVSMAVAVLGIVAVLTKYIRLMLNIIRDTPPPLLMGPCDFERIEGKQVNFRAFDGTALRGMFLTNRSADRKSGRGDGGRYYPTATMRGMVIFCHEYGSDMYSCMRYCQGLLEAGFDVFTFDFRSHGKSSPLPGYEPRLWCTDKEVSDCLGALALVDATLEDRGVNAQIGLFGISRGAGAAILTARHPHAPASIRAIIADSPFSTDITLEWSMKKWVHVFARVRFVYEHHPAVFWRFLRWMLLKFARLRFKCTFPSVRKALAKTNVPIFFIHGQKDSYIRPEQAEMLFGLAHRPRYLWVVGEAKHNQSAIAEPERYAAFTRRFFERYVAEDGRSCGGATKELQEDAAEFFRPDENICRTGSAQGKEPPHANQDAGPDRGPECVAAVQAVSKSTGALPKGSRRGTVGNPAGEPGR